MRGGIKLKKNIFKYGKLKKWLTVMMSLAMVLSTMLPAAAWADTSAEIEVTSAHAATTAFEGELAAEQAEMEAQLAALMAEQEMSFAMPVIAGGEMLTSVEVQLLFDDDLTAPVMEEVQAGEEPRETTLTYNSQLIRQAMTPELSVEQTVYAESSSSAGLMRTLSATPNTEGYIEIASAADLYDIRNLDGYTGLDFILTADIDLAELAGNWVPLPAFGGNFDGTGYTIKNLSINDGGVAAANGVGLFAAITAGGYVHDVTLQDVNIAGEASDNVGGLAGMNAGSVANCFVEENLVSGGNKVGGLVGNNSGTITLSAAGCVTQGQTQVGGLAGYSSGNISKCGATGSVTANNGSAGDLSRAGGFVGYLNGGNIDNCFARVSPVTGAKSTGVFVGETSGGTIDRSYSMGTPYGVASAADRGCFVGKDSGTAFSNCYYTSTLVIASVNGITNITPPGVYDNTTAAVNPAGVNELTVDLLGADSPNVIKDPGSYAGFDFDAVWTIAGNYEGLPVLQGTSIYGTCPEKPVKIYASDDLASINWCSTLDYQLMNDIDLKNELWDGILNFAGSFDGNNHIISNLKVAQGSQAKGGLFCKIIFGQVENLTIDGFTLETANQTSDRLFNGQGAIGNMYYGKASNLTAKNGTVYTKQGGSGMFGYFYSSTADDCHVKNCTIYGVNTVDGAYDSLNDPWMIGGLIGQSFSTLDISGCTVENTNIICNLYDIEGVVAWKIGGLIGSHDTGEMKIEDCHVIGGSVSGNYNVGGFIGQSYVVRGSISGCSSSAEVKAYKKAGGFGGALTTYYKSGDAYDHSTQFLTVNDCTAIGDVSTIGTEAGGFLSHSSGNSMYTNCYATGDVTGGGYIPGYDASAVGGFVGIASDRFVNCYATGDVAGNKGVGGFAGMNMTTNYQDPDNPTGYGVLSPSAEAFLYPRAGIINCYSTGDVTATDQFGRSSAGGFIGWNDEGSLPVNCYATGNVSGYQGVGGFIGTLESSGAIDCYASGKVTSSVEGSAGGFAGYAQRLWAPPVQFINCFFNTDTCGTTTGIAGLHESVTGKAPWIWAYPDYNPAINLHGLSNDQMQQLVSFTSVNELYTAGLYRDDKTAENGKRVELYMVDQPFPWDIAADWAIDEGSSMPYLMSIDTVQLLELTAANAGESTTVTLTDWAPAAQENLKINWSVDGSGEISAIDGKTVKVTATGDDGIRVNALIEGVKQESIKIMAGDGGDNTVSVLDLVRTLNIALEKTQPTAAERYAADANRDGVVNVQDVVHIVNMILGIS